jgi:hypothetical protein
MILDIKIIVRMRVRDEESPMKPERALRGAKRRSNLSEGEKSEG